MQDAADIAEARAGTLRRLAEMAERLTERAFHRAIECGEAEGGPPPDPAYRYIHAAERADADQQAARWMLVFDRLAKGLRLTLALEARLDRMRRAAADGASGPRPERAEASARAGACSPTTAVPRAVAEAEREREADRLPSAAALSRQIRRLETFVARAADPAAAPRVRTLPLRRAPTWADVPASLLPPLGTDAADAPGDGASPDSG